GDKHPRPQRGLLTRPPLAMVAAYRRNIDERMQALLRRLDDDAEVQALVELGLHHEQQHQELILTDLKHLLSLNPLRPAYLELPARAARSSPPRWIPCEGGVV